MRTRTRLLLLLAPLAAAALLAPVRRASGIDPSDVPGFHAPVNLPGSEGGSEPSLAVALQARAGARFASWQNPGEVATSLDGVNFTNRGLPDSAGGGDVTNAIDPSGTFYLGQFCGGAFELHACLERSVNGGLTWPNRTDFADMHPGAADRPWIEIWPHRTSAASWDPARTRVYLEYHTFSPEELAYVTVSTDGGQTFSEPKLITSDTNALVGSGCNTVPGGLAVDERDGTVHALWLSGNDVGSSLITGCNYSQIGPFNKAWVSTSTDGGQSWTARLAWTGALDLVTKIGDNASKIFPAIAVDQAGQVHVVLPVRHQDDPVGYVAQCQLSSSTCVETPQDTDLLLVTSPDRGAHWTPPASVESSSGSYFFPWAAAGSSGVLDVVYYKSATRQPNKRTSVWYIGFSQITGAVATYTGGAGAVYTTPPQWKETLLDPAPVHGNGTTGGGICTFGLFCSVAGATDSQNGNRSLADSIAVVLDPAGGANAVWSDDVGNTPSGRQIHFTCQSSGPSAFAGAPRLNGCYGPADLSIGSSDGPDPARRGDLLRYRLTVTNNGTVAMPSTTSGVTLSDTLPPGVTFVSATASSGSCAGSAGSPTVTCDLGILPGGASATVDLDVRVGSDAADILTNVASVSSLTDDPDGGNNTATEKTSVTSGANHAPVAADDSYTTAEDGVLTVAAPGVLGNDLDSDGDALTALLAAAPAHGALTLAANGSFLYTPDLDFNGTDSFTYRASDGSASSNVATVAITVNPVSDPPGRASGSGEIAVAGGTASFGFLVKRQAADGPVSGRLDYYDGARGLSVTSTSLSGLAVSGTTARISGACTRNGAPCTFLATVTDAGEPGAGRDRFTIAVSGEPGADGALTGGNVQVR